VLQDWANTCDPQDVGSVDEGRDAGSHLRVLRIAGRTFCIFPSVGGVAGACNSFCRSLCHDLIITTIRAPPQEGVAEYAVGANAYSPLPRMERGEGLPPKNSYCELPISKGCFFTDSFIYSIMTSFLVSLPSGKRISIEKNETIIGRNSGNDISNTHAHVSRRHCMISKKGIMFYITDLGSTNGTFLNGNKITGTVRLRNNDTISLGQQAAAYQFRTLLLDFIALPETMRKPNVMIPALSGIIVFIPVFVCLLFFINPRKDEKVEVRKGFEQLKKTYGENVFPDDPDFYAATEKTIADLRRDPAFPAARSQRLKYKDMIERILIENNLPVDFSFIPWAESGYNPLAYNAGSQAGGMWQLIPATARSYGLRVDSSKDERFDPVKATHAAALCIRDLISVFGNDSFLLDLAAYNAGDFGVFYALKKIENPIRDRGFWYLYEHNLIPEETKRYVLTILALIVIEREK
jgi:pSer/pThr/pTyr-binding forkhead associated (FHA) protein